VNEVLISPRIPCRNFFGDVAEVVLDRSTLAGVEVYEERSSPGAQQVARVWLTVQQLPAGIPCINRSASPRSQW
jgi:hypothetical protein